MTFAERVQSDVTALSEWRVLIRRVAEGMNVTEDVALRYYTLARLDMCMMSLRGTTRDPGDEWKAP